ncbi:ATP-grasp domain-containing protein [bacterium]|nr:ATP-grasp domain-containing protein [bacterium]
MARTTVGVLRGGTSAEFPLSLKSGAHVISALSPEKYDVRDILIDKEGVWHVRGMPVDGARALAQVDVVVNALHGGVGEDGSVQRFLERSGVPYVGSRPHAAQQSLNKIVAREILQSAGLRTPLGQGFNLNDEHTTREMARQMFEKIGPPYIVKPALGGGSHGVRYVSTAIELPDAIGDTLDEYGSVVVEEFVSGEELAVGVVEGYRNEDVYVLPPALVKYPDDAFHLSHHHYGDGLRHIVPSPLSDELKVQLSELARTAHRALELSDFSRADFILTRRGPVILEVDASPHIYEGSGFHHMLESVGSSLSHLLEHMIGRARS